LLQAGLPSATDRRNPDVRGDGPGGWVVTAPGDPGWRPALQEDSPSRPWRRQRLGYGLADLLVVVACSLAFAAVAGSGKHVASPRPPIGLIARELGTTPEQFRHAAERFLPRPPLGPPTEAQRRQLALALDVSVERLDTVMEKYRPDRLRLQ